MEDVMRSSHPAKGVYKTLAKENRHGHLQSHSGARISCLQPWVRNRTAKCESMTRLGSSGNLPVPMCRH